MTDNEISAMARRFRIAEEGEVMVKLLSFFLACPIDQDAVQRVTTEQALEARRIMSHIEGCPQRAA